MSRARPYPWQQPLPSGTVLPVSTTRARAVEPKPTPARDVRDVRDVKVDGNTSDGHDTPASDAAPDGPRPRRTQRWGDTPLADRPAARRQSLIEVGLDLLGTLGWAGTTVRAVCKAAELNPRYFYESFEDLDDLLLAVYDAVVQDAIRAVVAATQAVGDDPTDRVRASIECSFDFLAADPRRVRVLFVEATGHTLLQRRRLDTLHAMATYIQRSAERRYGGPPPGEHVGKVAANLLVGGAVELLIAWLDDRLDMPLEALVADATALFMRTGQAAIDIATERVAGEQGAPSGTEH